MSVVKHKVGEFYWYAWYDDEDHKIIIDEYGLRSIRQSIAHFTVKYDGITWGKRSKKHGDYGWLPTIPRWCRSPALLTGSSINRYAKTKASAIRSALAEARRMQREHKKNPELYGDHTAEISAYEKRLKSLKARLK